MPHSLVPPEHHALNQNFKNLISMIEQNKYKFPQSPLHTLRNPS